MQDLPPEPPRPKEEAILPGVETRNCPRPFLEQFDLAAASGGPLRLELISCGAFPAYGRNPGVPSPDGEKLARWSSDSEHGIEVAGAAGGQLFTFPNLLTFRRFAFSLHDDLTEGFAWTSGSDGLWSVHQDVVRPSGWALSELRPVRVGLHGEVRELPRLRDAGRLDAVHWVGADGLALAQFSTRGGYYRPERPNDPALAIIDTARGQVRDVIRARDLAPLRQRVEAGSLFIHDAAAIVLPDGRVRAVVELAAWREPTVAAVGGEQADVVIQPGYLLDWTEGSAPRLRAVVERSRSAVTFSISPDGAHLLVLRRLQPWRVIRECHGRCSGPPEPPPTPVEGVFAELIEVSSGRQIWRLDGRAEDLWNQGPRPEISPDGAVALLNLPPQDRRRIFALVRMRDGAILHRFSVTQVGSMPAAFGFLPDGKRVWVTIGGTLYRFRLEAAA